MSRNMKSRFYLTIIIVAAAHICFAAAGHLACDTVKSKYKKLYIVEFDDKQPIATRYFFPDPQSFDDLSSISDQSNSEVSKLLKVDFILVVKLKLHTKFLTFDDILALYKIGIKDRNLRVVLDDEIIDSPETMLVSQNQIESVLVKKGANGPYISITLI
jgi:hypothetical protein